MWRYPSPGLPRDPLRFYFPDDAFFTDHGTAIISNQEQNETIIKLAYPSGRIIWSFGHPGHRRDGTGVPERARRRLPAQGRAGRGGRRAELPGAGHQREPDGRAPRLPLPEIGVLDRVEDLQVLLVDLGQRPLGAGLLFADDLLDGREQRPVLQDQAVGFEDEGVLLAHPLADLALEIQELAPRPGHRSLQPFQLGLDPGLGHRFLPGGEQDPLLERDLAHADARRNTDPPKPDECHSPTLFRRTFR